MVDLPRATSLKNNESPFSGHQLSIALQLGVRTLGILVSPYWNIYWLDLMQILCKQPWILWVHECSSPVVSRRLYFPLFLLNLALMIIPFPSSMTFCEHWVQQPHGPLFSTPWLLKSFYVNHHLLHKEIYLMRTEGFTNEFGDINFRSQFELCDHLEK